MFWQINLFHLIIGGYLIIGGCIIDAGVARSLLKSMSKHGSEEGQQGRKEVPATGQSPLPAYGSHAIQKILERVSPSNVLEYRAMLDEAGFDTLESLSTCLDIDFNSERATHASIM